IVEQRRGGFFYGLKGGFRAVLAGLGFDGRMLSAGGGNNKGDFSPPFDHMAFLFELEDRWLVDVGVGESFSQPLLIDEPGEQAQNGEFYRIAHDEPYLILQRREQGGLWRAQYRFTLDAYQYADFAEMCRYHQTSPDSPFTQRCTCTRATPEGRITLTGM